MDESLNQPSSVQDSGSMVSLLFVVARPRVKGPEALTAFSPLKLSLSRMEAVREIQSFAEHQALFLSERYGCAIHRFAFRVQNYG